jgi:inner membrane protein
LEPITHLLTGACISRAGLNRKTALATATLVLAAEIPDIDVLASLWGRVAAFAHHRGFTHTFLGVPFDAALAVGLVYLWRRIWGPHPRPHVGSNQMSVGSHPKLEVSPATAPAWQRPRWGLLFCYGCLGALSHILLDFTNNYGVRPLAPFSWRWFSWDIIFIIEPLFLAALLLGLIAPSLFRLIHEEIGSRPATATNAPRGRIGAVATLVFMMLWTGFRDFEHRGAVAALQARVYQGAEPVRVSAYPYWVTPFQWHGVVETEKFFATLPVNSHTADVDPEGKMRIRYKPEETSVTLAAKKSYLGRVYLDWAKYPVMEVEKHDDPADAYTVRFIDLRFAYPERDRPSLAASVELDGNLKVTEQRFETSAGKK